MAKKRKGSIAGFIREVKSFVKDLDSGLVELTGRSLLRDFLNHNISNDYESLNSSKPDPYTVLGVIPATPRDTVKKVYLILVKIYHESGSAPNPDRMKEINNAYNDICTERGWPK